MSLVDDIKALQANLMPDNNNNEISPKDVRDSLDLILDNLQGLGSNYYGTITTSSSAITGIKEGGTVLPLEDGIYSNFGGLIRSNELCIFVYESSAWIKKSLDSTPTSNVFNSDSLKGLTVDQQNKLKLGFLDLIIPGITENDLVGAYQIEAQPGAYKIFIAKLSDKTSASVVGDIICSYNVTSVDLTDKITEVTLAEFSGSGYSGTAKVNWSILNSLGNIQGKSYNQLGFNAPKMAKDNRRITGANFLGSISTGDTPIPAPWEGAYYLLDDDGTYVNLDGIVKDNEIANARFNGATWEKETISSTINSNLFTQESLKEFTIEQENKLKFGFLDLNIPGITQDDLIGAYQIEAQSGAYKIFIAKLSDKASASVVGDIICSYNVTSVDLTDKITEVPLAEFSGSGYSGTAKVNWSILNGLGNVQGKSYNQLGFNALNFNITTFEVPSKQYVWREGDEVWIAAKWDFENDILIKFDNNELNNRLVFRRVGLAASVGEISKDIKRTPTTIITEVGEVADNIGPFKNSAGFWSGGGHQYPTNTADPKYPTANIIESKFYADGREIPEKKLVLCDSVQIYAKHELYDPASTPSGTNTVVLHEKLSYVVRGGNIETMCEFDRISEYTVNDYYGMQLLGASWIDKLYFAHGLNTSNQDWISGLVSGDLSEAPDVEKVILSKADKNICCALSMDITKGILLDRSSNLDPTDDLIFTSGSKTYWRLFGKNVTLPVGYSNYWRGVYNFFKNIPSPADFVYFQWEGNHKYLIVDSIDTGSGDYKIFVPGIQNQDIEVISTDATIAIDTVVKPDGLGVSIAGYGNAKLRVK